MNTTLLDTMLLMKYAVNKTYRHLSPIRAYSKVCAVVWFRVYIGQMYVHVCYPLSCQVRVGTKLGKHLMRIKGNRNLFNDYGGISI